jgi:hypothetical protein
VIESASFDEGEGETQIEKYSSQLVIVSNCLWLVLQTPSSQVGGVVPSMLGTCLRISPRVPRGSTRGIP